MEDETTVKQTFHLYGRHIDFLDKINPDNRSIAIRTVLDSIINGKEKAERKKIMDTSILISCLGLLLLIFSFLFTGLIQRGFMIGVGILVISYGLLGGIELAVGRTRNR